jgi:hypothetical protein
MPVDRYLAFDCAAGDAVTERKELLVPAGETC